MRVLRNWDYLPAARYRRVHACAEKVQNVTFQVGARVHCTGQAKADISINFIAKPKSLTGSLELVADVLRDGHTIFAGGQTLVKQPALVKQTVEQTLSTFLQDAKAKRGVHTYTLALKNAGTVPIDVQYVVFIVTS